MLFALQLLELFFCSCSTLLDDEVASSRFQVPRAILFMHILRVTGVTNSDGVAIDGVSELEFLELRRDSAVLKRA